MKPSLITNGWQLPNKPEAGLQNLLVSIDSTDLDAHERNRSLQGVRERIRSGIALMKDKGVLVIASVTVSKLVDLDALPHTLTSLGFEAVTFSYPRKAAFGSSSLVYSEDSSLVDFSNDERRRTERHPSREAPLSGAEPDGVDP